MENEKNQAQELSIQRYAIARLFLYITLLVCIVLFFIPMFPLSPYAKISAFQFYTADFSWVAIAGDFYSQWITICRIAGIMLGFLIALTSFLTGKSNVKRHKKAFNTAGEQALSNQMYITYVYRTLPREINALQTFLFMMFEMASVGSIIFTFNPDDPSSYMLSFLVILPLIIGGILVRNPIASLVCAKDIRLINEESVRFNNEKFASPTITSDFHAIGMLFGASENSSSTQNVTDVTEALREYKKLLDDGIITEEEFQAKKAELLNTSNDQKPE